MAAPYKLRCNLAGHTKDVRALCPALFPEGGVISGSRDCTTCVWMPNDHDVGFTQGQVLTGHSNFVAAVCVVPPDDNHPQGLVITGSNDNNILLFEPGKMDPVAKLSGHTNTVCSLAAGKFGFLLSGSWDTTARVWLNQKCVMTLKGHESAVWAVAVISEKGLMLTGSADKTIKLWKAGKTEHTFHGHEDCVRSLVIADENSFLSCSNDATVRRWLVTGDCLGVYYGHTNYVYSIALLPNGTDFVTSGEDRTVRVWTNGECVQTIPHPTQSVWCVTALGNGDIVSGSSDGIVRVFTREATRMASPDDLKAYDDLVASSTIPTDLGDINKDDLPGPEALANPGTKDNQSKMVRRGDKVELYTWDMATAQWTKVGDIVGASGGKQATSGKTLFEGKEYDYVFSVDIEEGKPPLKLPYNLTEDPWHAAQAFLHRHSLSQLFLDQVANFITTNAKGATPAPQPGAFADPFTGGNRYVPGTGGGAAGDTARMGSGPMTGSTASNSSTTPHGADPFTGSGSYRPGDTTSAPTSKENSYFPVTNFLQLDAGNHKQIMGKLLEFNKAVDEAHRMEEARLTKLESLLGGQPTPDSLDTLQQLLQWPEDKLFPALDILRLGVRHPGVSRHFCQRGDLLTFLLAKLQSGTAANTILSLRTLANLFTQPEGARLMGDNQSTLLHALLGCPSLVPKAQVALTTCLLNFSIAAIRVQDPERKSECVAALVQVLKRELESQPESPAMDNEAVFRALVAVGTLCHRDDMCKAVLQSLDFTPVLNHLRDKSEVNKVIECAELILES